MAITSQPNRRTSRGLTRTLAIGIPVVCVGLLVLAFHAITTPEHFALLKYGGVACEASDDQRVVYVQLALTEANEFPQVDTADLQGATNASLTQFGWLAPPLGFASGETSPTAAELRKAFAGNRYPRPLPKKQSNLILKITANNRSEPVTVDGVELLIDNGEPAYLQTLRFGLRSYHGHCDVAKG